MSERINWSRMSLDELEDFYWNEIARERLRDGKEPDGEPPSYQWLSNHGFSGIAYALREHHDLTLKQFFIDVVGLEPTANQDGYDWEFNYEETTDALESYLRVLRTRRGLAEETIRGRRSRLARYGRVYRDLHGEADILARLNDRDERPKEIERTMSVLDKLDKELSTDESKLTYLGDARSFYEYLVDMGRASYNPLENAAKQFRWERSEPDNPALAPESIRSIYKAANDTCDELIVIALAAWGLRPSEVAALHRSQVHLELGDPHLEFGEGDRKNGPGTVALLFGLDALAERLDELAEDSEWNGFLFPSNTAASGHRTPETVRRRFKRLANDAGVTVSEKTPTPKMCRRFWYSTYRESMADLLRQLEGVASDQGSTSTEVVFSNYLSEDDRRAHRRQAMRESLAEVFDTD